MQVILAAIRTSRSGSDPFDTEVENYLRKCKGVGAFNSETFRTEESLLQWLTKQGGRTQAIAQFLDGRGRQFSSEELARWIGKTRDTGTQQVIFAIGPADGWSEEARSLAIRSGGLLSLGPMTLAHSLARLVMAEQLYRACTILTGHPYHRAG